MAASTEIEQTAHQVDCFERHQNLLCPSAQVGLFKNLSPLILCQLEDSTEANLAGMHQIFLSAMKPRLTMTHLFGKGWVSPLGWLVPGAEKAGFTLATRINQASLTNHTIDDQSALLPTPSPKILENS